MRRPIRRISLLLVLLLALPAAGMAEVTAGYDVVACPQLNFSTLANFEYRAEYSDEDGLYLRLGEDNIPYVLITMSTGENRVTDPAAFFNDYLVPKMQGDYSEYGAFISIVHDNGVINGHTAPVLEVQHYNRSGVKLYFYAVFDVQPDYTAYYRARYVYEDEMALTLGAMETVATYLKPDDHYYDGNTAQTPAPQVPSANAATDSLNFAVSDINYGGMTVGRCAVPADYNVESSVICGTTAQSISDPFLLYIAATSADGIRLSYASARDYIEIQRWDGGTGHQDGVYNAALHIPMLYYKQASGFCDYWATTIAPAGVSLTVLEENQFPEAQPLLQKRAQEMLNEGNVLSGLTGVRSDDAAITVCARRYALEVDGQPYYLCVLCGVRAVQATARVPGILSDAVMSFISWKVPFAYTMVCPAASWDAGSVVFTTFVENTSASDEFIAANERLSNELWGIVNGRSDLSSGVSYSEGVLREEAASGDSYDDDRFTDYLFDQNDYTLSDGSHVKVSTAYSYVYEGDNGNVYYSDSAFAQPGGTTQLYPNR